jgi:spore coat polysaccharide biosynthesis protein SpsF (cytidylyltransferase family)
MLPYPNFICPFWTVGLDFQINNIFNNDFGYLKGDVLGADRLGIQNEILNINLIKKTIT